MKKWYYSRKFLFSFAALLTSVIAVSVYNNLNHILSNFLDFLKYGFGILGILTTLYNYYHKFHLFISRLKIIFLNSNATWNVSSVFDGNFDESILIKIKKKIEDIDGKAEFVMVDNNTIQAFSKGLNVFFDYATIYDADEDEHRGHLVLRIRDYNASYSLAMETLDEKIIPLMTLITQETKPEDSKYIFKIDFGKSNPFMGLAVKNIDKASIVDFSFMYNESKGISKRNVKVGKKGIECTTTTLSDFQTASGNFLSLVGD
ncbi:hypothetical protein PPOLYM_02571 [Paenibacillus polymyxa]|uniref:Uncharacterized protein n=1 Tax=Paenibacillus polymyxa TaxID=1406 RepID=A0AAP3ZVT6_PAEPO|nr:hypothetical protein [Paenibacillus polymyxa]APQ59804.1 hypothetical protein VK72_14360 [Paenibacillus polymyxa]MDH2330506.1 hypothetical protein [Paenibacillus polymyxa]VUG06178.1 hypothetical protein PPOLYM_02571 [Paenibacillus polymyxa]